MPQQQIGRHRVESWIYTVINPLIDAMRRETVLLKEGDLSWRHYSGKAQYLRRIDDYIDSAHLPNLEDFKIENAPYVDKFAEHDRLLVDMENYARMFQQSVLQSREFRNLVAQSLATYQKTSHPSRPDLQAMAPDLPKYVAEELINNTQHLPSHYTLSQFWDEFRDEFLEYRARSSFQEVEQARKALQDVSSRLNGDLADLRLALCREYDVPAAPIQAVKTGAEREDSLTWS